MESTAAVDDRDVRVLFIEDDPEIARMYKLKLEIDGYSVSVAADCEAGLRQARAEHPDLIFRGVWLPRLDGFHVLQELRSETTTKNIPVVILSNQGETEQVERGLNLGALEYLIKAETPPSRLASDVRKWTGSPY